MNTYLDFEKPLAELDRKIAELENLSGDGEGPSLQDEISRLRDKSSKQLHDLYKNLDPWRKTQVARHPERPHFNDYIAHGFEEFVPLAGDRIFGEDEAVVGGLARFRGRSVVVMGHEKGRSTESRIKHNFGMAHPEGYRKAVRLMELADKFGLNVLTCRLSPLSTQLALIRVRPVKSAVRLKRLPVLLNAVSPFQHLWCL